MRTRNHWLQKEQNCPLQNMEGGYSCRRICIGMTSMVAEGTKGLNYWWIVAVHVTGWLGDPRESAHERAGGGVGGCSGVRGRGCGHPAGGGGHGAGAGGTGGQGGVGDRGREG